MSARCAIAGRATEGGNGLGLKGLGEGAYVGLFVALVGILICWTATGYKIGTLRSMGPGFFPVCLGVALTILGVCIFVFEGGQRQQEEKIYVDWRTVLFVGGGVSSFALVIDRFGLAPAITVLVITASFAERGSSAKEVFLLAISLTIACTVVFVLILNISIPVASWF